MDVSRTDIFRNPARLDERTFEALFYEHYSAIYGVLFRLTGDPHEADDLTAETFWRLWERPPSRDENIPGWLYRVATYLGYNALRAGKRRDRYERSPFEQGLHGRGGRKTGESESPGEPDPALAAEQREERARVRGVLRQMALRDVQLLLMRHSGLAYKEIAAGLGIAPGSVGTLLSRAEARFAALYKKGEDHAPEK